MRALLDSHTFLWAVTGEQRLGPAAQALLDDAANEFLLSYVSIWELTIKTSLGRFAIPRPVASFLAAQAAANRIALLPISLDHIQQLEGLPNHHRDPFDRLLVAQARVEDLPMVSVDRVLADYGIRVIW